ncbi:MAG: VCBS repeat-containing protein [Phycisphaerae bacterium]|nr:VCBS repeat-containing protein [Saprospiraceae bacterium]
MKIKHHLPLAGLSLLFSLTINYLPAQNTHRVPADFPKIQAAIDAAQVGDTVLVSPGVYFENLQLRGRDIVLSSRYFLEADPAKTIRETVIDGSQPTQPDTASCILIWKGETQATVIQGFTLRGGKGTRWYDHYVPGYFREGGGILSEFSSPVIRHNIIRDNTVPKEGANLISHGGGGIRCGDGAPRIEGNQIIHNRADGYGGGIVFNYCPGTVVKNNIIAFNIGGKDYSGGGFWATGVAGTVITLSNNTIAYNQSPGPVTQFGGKAGGIWVFEITVKVQNNIVWGNTQATGKPIGSANALLQLQYNCVETGFGGTGTIAADPMFRDTLSFVLEAGSPAIDEGNPDIVFDDFSRNSRSAAFPARGKMRNDLGAFGGSAAKNPACPASFLDSNIFSKVLNSPVVSTPGDSRSVNWIDIDNDMDLDLFISNGPQAGENNFLYKNNGTGGFTAVTNNPIVQDGKPSDGATWGDYDNDGDVDCFVVNWYGVNNLCYKNKGDGTFEQITTGNFVNDGGFSETASWGDFDNDGWLDLYVTNSDGNFKNFLYRNLHDGTFQKVTTGSPVTDAFTSRSVNWTDFNNDGKLDLFVSNESNQNENLYRNDGNGSFTKLTTGPLVTAGGKTMSSSWGDYDNDGDLDVFLANDQGNDGLFRNDGNETFFKITTGPVVTSGGNSFNSEWADVDNDADLDLFVTNSFWGGLWKNFLFLNNGDGTFTKNTTEIPATDEGWSYGSAFGDWDCDGDLDLGVATCFNANQTDYLYENHSAENGNNWLEIKLIGTTSNRSAIGAKIRVTATINGQQITQLREISAQSGYCGQNQLAAHFGLADADLVTMAVEWPSGLEQLFGNLAANHCLTLIEGQAPTSVSQSPSSQDNRSLILQPNPSSDSVKVVWEQQKSETVLLLVFDLEAKLVHTQNIPANAGHNEWAMTEHLPAGNYTVTLQGKDWEVVGQWIKLK